MDLMTPQELLTDNGEQFTGRLTKPMPAERLFERFWKNGITHLLTKRRSPTTTGKIERQRQTLRRELLEGSGEFAPVHDSLRRGRAGVCAS
ncbi:hypothetical protein Cci01nite_83020 [Catellatospora citrea]|uniref:Integrase catalytic domain-containing protein n=1 Tax=Catellatospora citrea TaxID=53366 RepID=A0A8J3KQT2_9ACTN|nr:hypothetical protein Cci01nite_83020 [Catellatospora citrea]